MSYNPSPAARAKAIELINMESPFPVADRAKIVYFMLENGWLEPLTPFERLWSKVRSWLRK